MLDVRYALLLWCFSKGYLYMNMWCICISMHSSCEPALFQHRHSGEILEIIFKFIWWCSSFPEDVFFLISKLCLQDKTHKQPSCSTRVVHRLNILCSVMWVWASASHIYIHSLHIDHHHLMAASSISCPRKDNSNWKYLFPNHIN